MLDKLKAVFGAHKLAVMIGALVVVVIVTVSGIVLAFTHTKKQDTNEAKEEISKEEISKEEYYEQEEALDESEENVIFEETEQVKPNGGAATVNTKPYYIKVNRLCNVVTVYGLDEAGNYTVPVKAMVCSVGLNGGTPTGVFKTSTKYLWRALYGNVYGQYAYRIHGPILFHSVPYFVNGDKGSLEFEEYNKLGQDASMGCVRLAVRDAKWLMDNCPSGTTVEIYDSPDPGPLGKPSAYRINVASPCRGWDPTDPDGANPWRNTPPALIGCGTYVSERGDAIDVNKVFAIDYKGDGVGVSISGNVDANVVGSYIVTYTAVDENGNVATGYCNFIVQDTTRPVLVQSQEISIDQSVDDVQGAILACLQAKDGNELLDNQSITIDLTALQAELQKGNRGKSQTFLCEAYATDLAGNQSEVIQVRVNYIVSTPPANNPVTPPANEPTTPVNPPVDNPVNDPIDNPEISPEDSSDTP